MALPLKIEKISGEPKEGRACGVFTKRVTLADEEDLATIVACIQISGLPDSSGDSGQSLSDVFEVLASKIENVHDSILAAVKFSREAALSFAEQNNISLNFGLVLFFKDVCYVVRAGEEVKILVFAPGKSGELSFESGSGPVAGGQIYLLATKAFLDFFEVEVLKQAEVDLEGVIDGLATEISAQKEKGEAAAGFVQVGSSEGTKGPNVSKVSEVLEETESELTVDSPQLTDEGKEGEEGKEDKEGREGEEGRDGGDEQSRPYQSTASSESYQPSLPSKSFKPLKIFGFILSEIRKLKSGDVGAKSRLRRNIVVLSMIILLILGGSGFWAIRARNQRVENAEFSQHLGAANSKFGEAVAVIDLNRAKARDLLIEAEKEVNLALGVKKGNAEAEKLAGDIKDRLKSTEVLGNVNFETLKELPDTINSLSFSGKNLAAISGDKIFEVNVSDKSVEEIKGVDNMRRGYVFDNKAFVISSDGVKRIDLAGGKAVDVSVKTAALDINVFFGNVYLLEKSQILKIVPIEGGYAPETNYLNGDVQFGDKAKMAIDASIWVTGGSKVYKFTRGTDDHFEISGLTGGPPVGGGDFGLIYTSASLNNIYVVDITNSALLVIGKDGNYKRAYQSGEFAKATGIVVNDIEDTMYVSSGAKILEAKLEK